MKTLYTIGHSNHSIEEFIEMLQAYEIKCLVDIRRFRGSRKHPQFGHELLQQTLEASGIAYRFIENLGGRRKPQPDSKFVCWRNDSFRAYADYMQTEDFRDGISALSELALETRTAMMCSEAVWWRCHRSMVSDYMMAKGWEIEHIFSATQLKPHPLTQPATIKNQQLYYCDHLLIP